MILTRAVLRPCILKFLETINNVFRMNFVVKNAIIKLYQWMKANFFENF